MLKSSYTKYLILFCLLNIFLYLFIILFHQKVPFNLNNYQYNAHKYLIDPRVEGKPFNLLNGLAQFDAQWYLKIASDGYPKNPNFYNSGGKSEFQGLTYAFFPLYPLLLSTLNFLINNVLISAFLLTNLLLIANFISLYFVLKNFVPERIVFKTIFLIFLFPFSIFYRSYFTEELFLLILIWFAYFFIKNKPLYSSLLLGLLNITRGSGVLIFLPFLYYLVKGFFKGGIKLNSYFASFFISFIPLTLWSILNFLNTSDSLFFMKIRGAWTKNPNFIDNFYNNILTILNFPSQKLHIFHTSKIDILMILVTLILLILSRTKIPKKLWLISLSLFLSPLIFNDTMSYSRMQIVSFPLFLYLGIVTRGKYFFILVTTFAILLFLTSLLFVNWYWIG